MPPGNVTEMTGEERAQIAAWLSARVGKSPPSVSIVTVIDEWPVAP